MSVKAALENLQLVVRSICETVEFENKRKRDREEYTMDDENGESTENDDHIAAR